MKICILIHLNIQSIKNKIDALLSLVSDCDILCFIETHLDANILNHDLFSIFRNCVWGGVLVYRTLLVQVGALTLSNKT